jgi:voltage-gated potassium channel
MQVSLTPFTRRMIIGGLLMIATLGIGTLGYWLIEGWSPIEALFVAMMVISTLGFGDSRPTNIAGKVFTMILILGGVGTLYYLVGVLAQTLVEGQLGRGSRHRMEHRIAALRKHYIVCGYGRVGQQMCLELVQENRPFVVIDDDPTRTELLRNAGYLFIQGDASNDAILRQAGIMDAQSLLTAVASDAGNVYVTLSARALNPNLFIVARSTTVEAGHKLTMAGASRVVSPYVLGGRRMVSLALRPAVMDFLDVVMHSDDVELWIEEVIVGETSSLAGVSIGEADLRAKTGINILAIRHADGKLTVNPHTNTMMHIGDTLIMLGVQEELRYLRQPQSAIADAIEQSH